MLSSPSCCGVGVAHEGIADVGSLGGLSGSGRWVQVEGGAVHAGCLCPECRGHVCSRHLPHHPRQGEGLNEPRRSWWVIPLPSIFCREAAGRWRPFALTVGCGRHALIACCMHAQPKEWHGRRRIWGSNRSLFLATVTKLTWLGGVQRPGRRDGRFGCWQQATARALRFGRRQD